ncbi:acyl-CoA carboxylase epsilon subunit [Actinospica robiniae]|uniref:acyl-CoA carboxylase epsilon subunit n=1 Tax=Actinospica robiniae TaxID=304901 RepID=UPI003CCC3AE5
MVTETTPTVTTTEAALTEAATTEAAEASSAGTLRVVAGQPTAEELAALVVVLAARAGAASGAGAAEADAPRSVSAWTDRSRYVRSSRSGFGTRTGWRASALPN